MYEVPPTPPDLSRHGPTRCCMWLMAAFVVCVLLGLGLAVLAFFGYF